MAQQVQEYSAFINQHPNPLISTALRFSKFLGAQFASSVSEIAPILGVPPVLKGETFLLFCQSLFCQSFPKRLELAIGECVMEQAVTLLSKIVGTLFE